MPCPDWVLRLFRFPGGLDSVTRESDLYGRFLTLLCRLFPLAENFMVAPPHRHPSSGQVFDFTVVFFVGPQIETTVSFAEVKPPRHLDRKSTRERADIQMRDHIRTLAPQLRIPRLHSFSAMGARLAFYCYDAETQVTRPPAIARDQLYANDSAPQARWDVDFLSDEGYEQLVAVVNNVKDMCSKIT